MIVVNERDFEYRHGDHGPKYFMQGPRSNFGTCCLNPGQIADGHFHNKMEENFYVLEGKADFIIDGVCHTCSVGDFIHMEPGEVHEIINNYDAPVVYIVNTAPYIEGGDKIMAGE